MKEALFTRRRRDLDFSDEGIVFNVTAKKLLRNVLLC